MRFRIILALFVLLMLPFVMVAETVRSTVYFKNIDGEIGLPDNSVNVIAEDSLGCIWIGTWNGLARFDGYAMEVFRHSDTDSSTLADNMIRALLPVKGGIFVGTDYGLDFYGFDSGNFSRCMAGEEAGGTGRLLSRISRLHRSGRYIFALTVDGDILRYDSHGDRDGEMVFERLRRPADRRYADICGFYSGRILALSDKCVVVFDGKGEKEISRMDMRSQFDSNMNIFCDTIYGKIYIGGGIGKKSRLLNVKDRQTFVENETGYVPPDLMRTVACADGRIAFATDGGGLYLASPGGETEIYTPDNSSISGDALYTVFSDRLGNIWCGTYRRGLSMLSPELNICRIFDKESGTTSHNIVTGMSIIGERMYLALDGGGIDIYDFRTGKTENRNSGNSGLPGNNVTGIISDGERLWLTVYSHGLVEYDPVADSFACYPLDVDVEPGNKVWTLATGDNGDIIVGGLRLHSFNKNSKRFREIAPGRDLGVMSIVCSGPDIWIGTRYKGVLVVDRKSYAVKSDFADTIDGVRLPGSGVECLYKDSRDILWVAFGNKKFRAIGFPGGQKVRDFGMADGLTDTRVKCVAEDPYGNLWVGTVNGLFRFVRSRNRFVKVNDSRLPREYNSNAVAFHDGNILIGSTAGLVSIPYSSVGDRFGKRPAIISAIDILDGTHRHISLYGSDRNEVELDADENFFTVIFSVPEMSNPDCIQLECLLEGFEKDWRNISQTRCATYTNVPPGRYLVKVRQSGADGEWSTPVALRLTINSPWYLAWWAISLWAFLIVGIIMVSFLLWRRYSLSKTKAMEAEMEKENARKFNEAKLDFFAGLSHELRTQCFLISAQIEGIINGQGGSVSVSSLGGIYHSSVKLNKLVGSIIDFRKMESGNLKLATRETDMSRLLSELSHDYERMCRLKGLEFEFIQPEFPVIMFVDSDKMEFIVANLIANAVKYTPPNGGKVALCLESNADFMTVMVQDTGIGIMKDRQEDIFKPFFRTERGKSESYGDGIGLSFVKSLVELHGGTITVDSDVNEGSKFIVRIPRIAAHPDINDGSCIPSPALPAKRPDTGDSPMINNPTAIHSILIVEDEDDLRGTLSKFFWKDYKVASAADCEEGLRLMESEDFDIIITDIMMSGKDGHYLINAVRSDKKNSDVRIIVLSALGSDDDMLRSYQEGADIYLTKPVSLKMLRYHVDHLLSEEDISSVLAIPSTKISNLNRDERRFLLKCRTIIDETLLEKDFGIEFLADRLAMSHSALYKRIKALTGTSVIDFINEYRICKAVVMFRQGMTNVQKVGELCGFRDVKTFRETFKKKMNMLPKQYVMSLNGDNTQRDPEITAKDN